MTEENKILKEKIKSFPLSSGVYLMQNAQGEVIYVGKALNLKKRVQSYFTKKTMESPKTKSLILDIEDIEYIPTNSEAEALILEASLIKKYKTKYNIELRDDKMYPYIEVTDELFPRVKVVRPKKKDPSSQYYGPYVQPKLIREALGIIRRIFPFRNCEQMQKGGCLDYHMHLCLGPCRKEVSRREYLNHIKNVCLIIDGKKDILFKKLRKQMAIYSSAQKYEEASKIRDQLRALGALFSGTKGVNYYTQAQQLQRAFSLSKMPERIEAFDISNIMGEHAVGAMVSFFHGKPDKKNYRKFKIKEVQGIDDFKMIAEIVRRRYRRLKNEKRQYPDLVVIDGGRGQLSAALEQLKLLDVHIPIVSLAKREEDVFLPGKRIPIKLSKDSLGLQLLQRLRDEVHRFGVSYHRKLRGKSFIS